MPSVTYQFEPGQTVYNVNQTTGVNQAVVTKVTITFAIPTIQTTMYDIQFCNPSIQSASVAEGTLFSDLNSALYNYGVITTQYNSCPIS